MKTWIYLIAFSLQLGWLPAQVSFRAEVDRTEVNQGQQFRVNFVINQEGRGFQAPSFEGFRVLGGPATSISSSIDNSGVRYSLTYTYLLKADQLGEHIIGPAKIQVKGKSYQTQNLKIKVVETKRTQSSSEPELAFIKPYANKTTVYVGEPLMVANRIYIRKQLQTGRFNFEETPKFEGFYKEQIQRNNLNEKLEYINNLAYITANIDEHVIIPQKPGSFDLGSATISLPVRVNTGKRDYFGFPLSTTKELSLQAHYPKITVKPLPDKGRPQNFSGAVGDFSIKSQVSSTEINMDGSISYTIRIEGKGNIKFVELPEIEFPSAFEVFDPEIKESSSVNARGMSGYKEIEYLLVPRYGGSYKIEPIVFNYFDPKQERYVQLETEAFEVSIKGGGQAAPRNSTSPLAGESTSDAVDFLNKDILFIKTKASNWHNPNEQFLGSGAFWGWFLSLVSLGLSLIAIWWRKKAEFTNRDSLRKQRAGKAALKKLRKAQAALKANDAELFYQELETAIIGFFSDKFDRGVSGLSKEYLQERLSKAQVLESDIKALLELLEKSEMARFTGLKLEAAAQDYDRAIEVLTEIEKQL
tara:strand:+ start:3615 stop:5369 length:1755 start_codon:yes stop_codon:yes gene_type:complete